jgi:hypothetical protein
MSEVRNPHLKHNSINKLALAVVYPQMDFWSLAVRH